MARFWSGAARVVSVAGIVASLGSLGACQSSSSTGGGGAGGMASPSSARTKSASTKPGNGNPVDWPMVRHPKGTTGTVSVRAALAPLGQVPYDNLSLPIVSPDGQFVATQAGLAPTWGTLVAADDASIPEMTRIEIYRLDRRDELKAKETRNDPHLQFTLSEPAVLGRSCDAEGFLIESPRSNGARWIGKVSWATGDVEWLVRDDHINAFACLGPNGRLAWSRRGQSTPESFPGLSPEDAAAIDALSSSHFDLAIRTPSGQWTMPRQATDDDWLMPTWSGHGDRLFVLHLNKGNLEAVYASAGSLAGFRQSLQRFQLSSDSTISTAYQALNGVVHAADAPKPVMDQLVYFHPSLGRVAFWRPLAHSGRRAMYLNPKSIAAHLDEEDLAIVSTDHGLIRQRLSNYNQRITLTSGSVVPRPTWASPWPYVLLNPREGWIGLAAMRLMPIQ